MGRRRIECRVGRVGALWWRDNWPAARAAFKTCGGGVTIVISTGVRRCGRWECSKPKAGRLGGPWKADTVMARRHTTRRMVRVIERCILGCCADGQRFLQVQLFCRRDALPARWRLATRLSVHPSRQRGVSRVGYALRTRLVDSRVERRAHHTGGFRRAATKNAKTLAQIHIF